MNTGLKKFRDLESDVNMDSRVDMIFNQESKNQFVHTPIAAKAYQAALVHQANTDKAFKNENNGSTEKIMSKILKRNDLKCAKKTALTNHY